MARRVWGIDLGRSAVKGVLLEATDDGAQIVAAEIVPLEGPPPDPSQDPTRDARLWKALRTFHEKHRLDKLPICVAIPAQNTFIRDLSVASVGRRKLDQMVRYEASNEIPFVLDEVVWDYALFPAKAQETTRKGLLMAVKKNVVQTYLQVFAQLQMGPVALITLSPLALLSFLRLELGEEARALALDIGAENTNILVLDAGRFWIRNILSGGNRVTALLQQEFDLEFEPAQKAKENIAQARYAKQIMAAVLPAIHELVRNVKTNLTYLERAAPVSQFGATYVFGGGAKLLGLRKQVGTALRQDMQELKELHRVTVAAEADVASVRAHLDRLAVAIGAGLEGLGRGAATVSFIPKEDAAAAHISRTKCMALAAVIAVWAVMLTLYVFERKISKATAAPLEAYRKLWSIARAKDHDLAEALNRGAEEAALQSLLEVARGKDQAAGILTDMVRAFAATNRASPYRFQIYSFVCREAEDVAGPPAEMPAGAAAEPPKAAAEKPTGWIVGNLKGRIALPRGGTPTAGYRRFVEDLLVNLRSSHALAKATGQATFHKGQATVASEQADWSELVRSQDQIATMPDRKFYSVASVTSSTELRLSPPFPEEDFAGQYVICRVLPVYFNEQLLEFTVQFEVPRAPPMGLGKLLEAENP